MSKTNKVIASIVISVVAIFVIGYLALGPIDRVFISNPADVFGYGVHTLANGAQTGINKVQDAVSDSNIKPNTATLVTSTHSETRHWKVPIISQTFTMKPSEVRTYRMMTEQADTAYLTGKANVVGGIYTSKIQQYYGASAELMIDNGECKKITLGCNSDIIRNASSVNLSLYPGSTQNLVITNHMSSAINVTLDVDIDYTRIVQVQSTK